jgi:predicted nucleotidyltransferase
MSTDERNDHLRQYAQTHLPAITPIVNSVQPDRIILFGSYAYGRPTGDSDVDLLVIMDSTASPKERYLAISGLLYPRPFPVDILVRTPQEIEHALQGGDFFIAEIMSKGHVLYERRHRPTGLGGAG